jgi:prophage tail gpP-like protein
MSNRMGGERDEGASQLYRPAHRQEQRAASVAMVTKQASRQAKRTTTQARRLTAIIGGHFATPGSTANPYP